MELELEALQMLPAEEAGLMLCGHSCSKSCDDTCHGDTCTQTCTLTG